jgi:DNA-binding IscR family transcriptional regulator
LARTPRDITLKDILLALEESMCLVECTEKPMLCQRSGDCLVRDVWSEVTGKMFEALESFTLEALLERQKLKTSVPSYSI